ncbi:MAG: 1-deoxy-D-xylulose-5-phosphate reductoisomerase [Nitriliruptorales bacterium]|nr:1-deoxy-D-xylulose-5-phosphate reductoisomerase [Nitriliruptorales bacterium]
MTILGSTGSIGTQALEVIAAHPEHFVVSGLAAGSRDDLLVEQARAFGVRRVALADPASAARAREALRADPGPARPDRPQRPVEVLGGPEGVLELAGTTRPEDPAGPGGDVVLNGIVGSRGLGPTLAALRAGRRVALANKESLIVGGSLVRRAAYLPDQLVPVDSEHSALAQCLRAGRGREVARVVLTASGGPFRGRSLAQLAEVTVADALAHPTWSMGSVITVNSATLANKGQEVIEAHLLFDVPYERIAVVVHPQSIVHGMVEFCDGATMAKLSPPDMRLPIQLALGWPERLEHAPARMDWSAPMALQFEPVDGATFPMLDLAFEAGRRGGTAPAVYNAANEEAVEAFLDGRLPFLGIPTVVEAVLEGHPTQPDPDLETVLAIERDARATARTCIVAATGA